MGARVLLVEDDSSIAEMLKLALRQWGYDILHAANSEAAVEIARIYGAEIRVALCDVVLPDGGSPAVSEAIRANCPGVWLIYTSGYPIDVLTERGLLSLDTLKERRTGFISKPFLPRDVRDAIGCALLTHFIPEEKACASRAH
jgi:CheY-like chemotaxis protein